MYSTCLFCHVSLGRNEVIEPFPVGRKLAYDTAKGRLWVVCTKCGRWNLTPLEERWEAMDECERRFRDTRVRASSDNIGLAKLREGLELVRVGAPLRPEFAAWRYGATFGRRHQRTMLAVGAGAAVAVAVAPAVVPVIASSFVAGVLALIMGHPAMVPFGQVVMDAKHWIEWERPLARVAHDGVVHTVRVKHLRASEFVADPDTEQVALQLVHDEGTTRITGRAALAASGQILAAANQLGAGPARVRAAVDQVEQAGDAARYFASVSKLAWRRRTMGVLTGYRPTGALHLTSTERLALEMAVHEETERRALEGELTQLAQAWREAEELAAIADSLLPPSVEDYLRDRGLRRREAEG